jgi:hypothetical protein
MLVCSGVSIRDSLRAYSGDDRVVGFTRPGGPTASPYYWRVMDDSGFGFQLKVSSENGVIVGGSLLPTEAMPLVRDQVIPQPSNILEGVPVVELSLLSGDKVFDVPTSPSVVIDGRDAFIRFVSSDELEIARLVAVESGRVRFLIQDNAIIGVVLKELDSALLDGLR